MNLKHIALSALTLLTATATYGVASRQRPVEVAVPGGGTMMVVPVGDEHSRHYVSAVDGATIDWLDSRGSYKSVVPMSRMAASRASQHITTFPTLGTQRFLVVMVEFANKAFTATASRDEIDRMFNAHGYDTLGGTGSVADYYRDNSAGQFDPIFDVVGPVRLSHDYAYYGSGSDDSRAGLMVIEACQAIDGEINFADYDLDGNGEVDTIYFIYAGKGEADGGDADTIWPHSWNLSDQDRALALDGVDIQGYACSPELDGSAKLNGMGTPCHEFAHVLGLPDLYCTNSYVECLHPYDFSLMARGNYLNDGRTPPALSAYERYELGWLTPRELSHPLNVTLDAITASNDACRIATERTNEYFLFENRQNSGWDTYLPAHGMLVWHIDYNANIWDRNRVNATPSHQYVDIVEANGATTYKNEQGFTFPGASRVTSFGPDTRPALVSWSGTRIDLPITEIAEQGGTITFKVAGGKTPVGAVTGLEATKILAESAEISWQAATAAKGYTVTVNEGEKLVATITTAACAATITGLWPGKVYSVTVTAFDDYERGLPAAIELAMPEPTFDYMQVAALAPADILADGFTARWEPLAGAVSYLVTVSERRRGEPVNVACNFTDKQLPEGFSTSSNTWISMAGYYGDAAPSLRLGADGDYLASPYYADEISALSFWMRAQNVDPDAALRIDFYDRFGTPLSALDSPLSATAATVSLDSSHGTIPPGTCSLRLTFVKAAKATVNIDDLVIGHGADVTDTVLAGYDRYDAGTATELAIGSLRPESGYCYRVEALDAHGTRSLPSATVELLTPAASGLAQVAADAPLDIYSTAGILLLRATTLRAARALLPPGIYLTPAGTIKL